MWWRKVPSSRMRLLGLAVLAATGLSGCLAPMYGQFAEGGPGLQSELQAIAIEPIPERIGHYLGNDLIFDLNGTGSHPNPKYRLFVTLNESVQTPLIDTVSGRASSATVVWSSAGRSKVEAMTSPLTVRCMSVTSSGRSSTSTTIRWHSGLLTEIALAMACRISVLPAFGGETISPRWPLPIGATRSMIRVETMFGSVSSRRRSCG